MPSDFFVRQLSGAHIPACSQDIWDKTFELIQHEIPSFIDVDTAQLIFTTGKMRVLIGLLEPNFKCPSEAGSFYLSDLKATLERVNQHYKSVLSEFFFGKFKLYDHFLAIRDLVLFLRGDFSVKLMESLS